METQIRLEAKDPSYLKSQFQEGAIVNSLEAQKYIFSVAVYLRLMFENSFH